MPDNRECDHHTPPHKPLAAASAPSDPLSANCRRDYTAHHHSGTRPLEAINLIVLHSTEGATAESAARWFTNPDSKGSTHLIVDDNTCYRTLRDDQIPWGAKGANTRGLHIEQAGYAKWTAGTWTNLRNRTLRRAAFKTALHCKRYGIPVRWLNADALKLGLDGITDHNQCSKAYGGTHWDPGPGWPRALFMTYVRLYWAAITVRRIA